MFANIFQCHPKFILLQLLSQFFYIAHLNIIRRHVYQRSLFLSWLLFIYLVSFIKESQFYFCSIISFFLFIVKTTPIQNNKNPIYFIFILFFFIFNLAHKITRIGARMQLILPMQVLLPKQRPDQIFCFLISELLMKKYRILIWRVFERLCLMS